jgi:spore coat protein U-like protein
VKKALLAASALSLLAVSPSLGDSATVGVSATVVNTCTVTATAVAFGDYDPMAANVSAPLKASGAVALACTRGAAPSVGLGPGANGDGSARRMRGAGSGLLTYELYKPSSTAPGAGCLYGSPAVWSDSAGGLLAPGAVEDRKPRAYRICGQVGAGQSPPAGSYTDTVVVTVNF